MELDDLQRLWQAPDAARERPVVFDRARAQRVVRRALVWHTVVRAAEVLAGVSALGAFAVVLARHAASPSYLVAGGLSASVIAIGVVHAVRLLSLSRAVDVAAGVAVAQTHLARLRRAEFAAVWWGLCGGVLCWLPILLLLFEAITGLPVLERVEGAWLLANAVFGALLFGAGSLLARRWNGRREPGPWARRLMDTLGGQGLRAAERALGEVVEFAGPAERG